VTPWGKDAGNMSVILGKIKKSVPKLPDTVSLEWRECAAKCLCKNEKKRAGIDMILEDPWMKRVALSPLDLLNGLSILIQETHEKKCI